MIFGDDTTCYIVGKTLEDILQTTNNDLKTIYF